MKLKKWRAGILPFEAARDYENPFLDLSVMAVFTGPHGETVRREAYWDGGRSYKVSFAPTAEGKWTYRLSAPQDSGLDGVSGELECVPYEGDKDIYRHGFLKVSPDGRYLMHADGTPFFWLGDTHWGFIAGEKWDWSNHPKMDSMFKGMVDKRVSQKFTVYQTNLRSEYWGRFRGTHYWVDGKEGLLPDVSFYQQEVDKRMQYIADAGLVNALGFAWSGSVVGRLQLQKNLARYIIARYGALPMVWTLAGEAAGYSPAQRQDCIDGWREVAKTVEQLDGYGQLQTAHYNTRRPFEDYYYDEDWFDFTLNQAGHGDFPIGPGDFQTYRREHPDKPFVEGESLYEFCSTLEPIGTRMCTPDMMRRVAYLSMQAGGCGYTYGAQGIWDTMYEKPEKPDPNNIFNQFGIAWYEAIEGPGADQLTLMREFYENAHFERLRPAMECITSDMIFGDPVLVELRQPQVTASENRDTLVAYYPPAVHGSFKLQGLAEHSYLARWFDPRTGAYTEIARFTPQDGCWNAPDRPGAGDWLLILTFAEA